MRALNVALFLSAALLHLAPAAAEPPATPQGESSQTTASLSENAAALAFRQETLARAIGTSAYIYAYPAVDYERLMYTQTNPGLDPTGAYAPVNRFYFLDDLASPGGPFAGRAPNQDTLYFQAWYDLRQGPVRIDAPDTEGRYYNLDYVDQFSETNAHTGRRTTGTKAQSVYLVGPTWSGTAPAEMHLVRMKTDRGIVIGRVLVTGQKDLAAARAITRQFRMVEAEGTAAAPTVPSVPSDVLDTLKFFEYANRVFKESPVRPEEVALLDQFDSIGIGPSSDFNPSALSAATRRGLLAAIADGKRVVRQGRMNDHRGWTSPSLPIGTYGTNYLARASVEYVGLLANAREEAVYPKYRLDRRGDLLSGSNRYRLVLPANMPVDAFWSLTSYENDTFDLIPNPSGRYSVGSRDPRQLKVKKDGSTTILIQREQPKNRSVNWLPVGEKDFYLILRLYQPKPTVFASDFALPEVELCGVDAECEE